MLRHNSKNFVDDMPITAITIVEDMSNCPSGFSAITKIYDTDLDADLWKDSGFFTKKVTRYLCTSKEKSIIDYVLENLVIVNEKELPPEGYGSINKTNDTGHTTFSCYGYKNFYQEILDQKAWRKKQLCFKLSRRNICHAVVTDIILLSKSRKAPEGYHLIGDLNGLLLCMKLRPAATVFDNIVPTSVSCNGHSVENVVNGNRISSAGEEAHDYEKLVMKPVRPAPVAPSATIPSMSGSYQGLQGVPFMLNSRLEASMRTLLASLPEITIKTKEDIEKELIMNR